MNLSCEPPLPGTAAVQLAWPAGALLGEGPVWVVSEQALYFVDIKGGGVHRWTMSVA